MPTSDDALNAVDEQSQLDYIRKMPPVGIEAFWLDAGWFAGGWPYGAGNWYPDPKKFPHGMKPVGDAAHQKGMKFLRWFEPGRLLPGTHIANQHPDWHLALRRREKRRQVLLRKPRGTPVDDGPPLTSASMTGASISIGKTTMSSPSVFGVPRIHRIARASRKTMTSKVCTRSGMNC